MSESTSTPRSTKTLLGQLTLDRAISPEYAGMNAEQRVVFDRHDAVAHGYAWGRLDQGHAPVVSLDIDGTPNTTDTTWAFGGLYARMNAELDSPTHERHFGFSVQSAWDYFVATGCPEGHLPMKPDFDLIEKAEQQRAAEQKAFEMTQDKVFTVIGHHDEDGGRVVSSIWPGVEIAATVLGQDVPATRIHTNSDGSFLIVVTAIDAESATAYVVEKRDLQHPL